MVAAAGHHPPARRDPFDGPRHAAGGLATLTDEDDPYAGRPRPVREVGAFLYEPDGAVIRAGLVTAVAAGVGGGLVDEHIAYVTSDEAFHSPFARSYRVLEELPYREKQLKAALRERGIGRLTIKKRGVDVVPEQLRKRLALAGDQEATIVLTRVAGARDGAARRAVLAARPLDPGDLDGQPARRRRATEQHVHERGHRAGGVAVRREAHRGADPAQHVRRVGGHRHLPVVGRVLVAGEGDAGAGREPGVLRGGPPRQRGGAAPLPGPPRLAALLEGADLLLLAARGGRLGPVSATPGRHAGRGPRGRRRGRRRRSWPRPPGRRRR